MKTHLRPHERTASNPLRASPKPSPKDSHFHPNQNKSVDLSDPAQNKAGKSVNIQKMPSMGFFPAKKTVRGGVWERLAKQKGCNHEHHEGNACPHSHMHNIKDRFLLGRMRRPSKSWHTSPQNRADPLKKTNATFSRILDSSNIETEDPKKMQSMLSLDPQNTERENKEILGCFKCLEGLNANYHKDYLIGKLCAKLRILNKENSQLTFRVDRLEKKNSEFNIILRESIENEIDALGKERFSVRLENSVKENPTKEEVKENPVDNQRRDEIEEKHEGSIWERLKEKQEKVTNENMETVENLLMRIKTLENERNRYFEQMMTVQKKNEAFFIENSELCKTNQKLLSENESLQARLKVFETTASLKKTSPIFKSIFTNESTLETEEELLKQHTSPNDEIVREALKITNVKSPYEILTYLHNSLSILQFCQEICRKVLLETEAETPATLKDFLLIFDRFFEDKKSLEEAYIKFKRGILKAILGKDRTYEPMTAEDIVGMVERTALAREKEGCEFVQILSEIKKCFSLEFKNEAQLLSFLNNIFLEHEEIYRIAHKIKEMMNFNERSLEITEILRRALVYLENSIYSTQVSQDENGSILNSHYRSKTFV